MSHVEGAPRIRVAAILVKGNHILLVRHVRDDRTYWLLPGGGVEYGESLDAALVRELKEEANLNIRVDDLVILNDSIPPDRHRHILNVYFTGEVVGGELRCASDHRVAEFRWTPLHELPNLTFFPDIRHELLAAIRDGFPHRAAYLGNLWKE